MIQEIVFTSLPNQRVERDNKSFLKISVFVSPHLKSSNETVLGEAPDLLNWAEKIVNSSFSFRITGLNQDIPATLNSSQIDVDLYKAIFHSGIRIEKFETGDLHTKAVLTYPAKHVQSFIIDQMKKHVVENPSTLLPVTDFVDPSKLGIISNFLLDNQIKDESEIESNMQPLVLKPFLKKDVTQVANLRNSLKSNRYIQFNPKVEPRRDFIQFMDFHKSEVVEKLKPIIIKKPEFEFHNILSVLSAYPQLMRKLGFILDFEIPFHNSYPAKSSLRLIPDNISFEEKSTKISLPLTAYNLTSKAFLIADKNNSTHKNGFVKINSSEFTVVQIDTDGIALKTAQAVEKKADEVTRFFEKKFEVHNQIRELKIQQNNTSNTGVTGLSGANMAQSFVQNIQKGDMTFQKMKPIVKMQLVEPPLREGLNTVRSAGIGLVRNGAGQDVAESLTRNFNFQKSLIDNAKIDPKLNVLRLPEEVLYSDDLVMAYRMDVAYEDNPTEWYSLHQRKMSYSWYDLNAKENPIENADTDEGYVELAVVEKENVTDKIFVSETLARWEGWSLSVGRPGMAINDSESNPDPNPEKRNDFVHKSRELENRKYSFDPTVDFRVNAQSDLVPGTLPRLRFGKSYRIRVRTVDLAGNSVPLNYESDSPSETHCTNIRYLRYEPMLSPITLLGNQLRDGESLERMVIRSNWDENVEKYEKKNSVPNQDSKGLSQRFLLPPKNSQLIAETHGFFERAFTDPQQAKAIYQIITSHEGLYQPGPNNSERVYSESDAKIIYLPDPMAAGIALFADSESNETHSQGFNPRMFSYFSKDEIKSDNTNKIIIPEDWYNTQAIILKLEEGNKIDGKWDGKNRTFTVSIPKGERLKIKISTFWREEDVKKLSAIWQMIQSESGSKRSEIEKIALSGQHWMVSPSRTFELIHAVQQPIEAPVLQKIVSERDFADTSSLINLKCNVHGESTQTVSLIADWTEQTDDGISVDIGKQEFKDTVPGIDVFYHDKSITIGNFPELRPDLNFSKTTIITPLWQSNPKLLKDFDVQPGSSKISNSYRLQADKLIVVQNQKREKPLDMLASLRLNIEEYALNLVKLIDLRNYPLEHAFSNTRHRWVNYKIVAESRYSDLFTAIKKKNSNISFSRESDSMRVNILSSVRPAKPEIDYVIPAFEWEKYARNNITTHIRHGGVLRVYLKRPWFSSGDDEKLAVVIPNVASGLNYTIFQKKSYTDYFTHWGTDPLFVSETPSDYSPHVGDFRNNSGDVKDLTYPDMEQMRASAVVYQPVFDREKQMWYADIALDTAKMYFPFIKLALARYQEHSVKKENIDVCLSPVVMSTMIQMVPTRTASVELKPGSNKMEFNIKLSGPTYSQRVSGSSTTVRISVVDSELNQPVEGFLIDKTRILSPYLSLPSETEGWSFPVGRNMKGDNFFEINETIELPAKYKTQAFQIIIEEVENAQFSQLGIPDEYKERFSHPEETERIVYVDVFDIGK